MGICEFSSIETKSRHTTTRVVYVIGYTKCTQTPKIIPYLAAPLVGGGFTYVGILYTETEGRTDGLMTVTLASPGLEELPDRSLLLYLEEP